MKPISIGRSRQNILYDTPLITKNPRPSRGRVPSLVSASIKQVSNITRIQYQFWLPVNYYTTSKVSLEDSNMGSAMLVLKEG